MVQNRCDQSGHKTLKRKDCISKNEQLRLNQFSGAGANLEKLKVFSMIFGWAWSKMDVVQIQES